MKCIRLGLGLMVFVSGFFLGGCASLSRPGSIAVAVVDLRPLQTSLFESSVALTLRFTNEAMEPVTLAGSTHRLYLNGTYVGRAVSNERLSIPQLGTATQTVTVYLENLTLMRKATELTKTPKIAYRLDSGLHPVDGQSVGSIKATAAGELDLSGLGLGALAEGRGL